MSDEQPFLCPAGFPVDPDTKLCLHGEKGDKGAKGDRGEKGMPRGQRYAIVYLFLLALALAAVNLFWTSYLVQDNNSSQHANGQLLERKLCQTFSELAALKPPAGNPLTNPSRAYDQQLHFTLDQLGIDLGCTGGTP